MKKISCLYVCLILISCIPALAMKRGNEEIVQDDDILHLSKRARTETQPTVAPAEIFGLQPQQDEYPIDPEFEALIAELSSQAAVNAAAISTNNIFPVSEQDPFLYTPDDSLLTEYLASLEESKTPQMDLRSMHDAQTQTGFTEQFTQVITSNIKQELIKILNRRDLVSIKGAMYRFTLNDIAELMVQRMKNDGVSVKMIVDREGLPHHRMDWNAAKREWIAGERQQGDFITPLKLLYDNGARIYVNNRFKKPSGESDAAGHSTMHNKFLVFRFQDGTKLLWLGSWNCTAQAEENYESVVLMNDAQAIEKMCGYFNREYLRKLNADYFKLEGSKDLDPKKWFARKKNSIPEGGRAVRPLSEAFTVLCNAAALVEQQANSGETRQDESGELSL